jgi:hypothetical protein
MKAFDIAFKDLTRSFRSAFAVVFMFGVPLLVTGMFYFMFGNIASDGEFTLPKTKVVIANLDEGGPKFQVNPKNIPGGKKADTMGDLIVNILQSEDMADLIEVTLVPDAEAARASVDGQINQVAIIIPSDFSHQFADVDGKAVIEFYQDPTLTLGPAIMRSILNRFMDGMAGVKIAVNVFLDEADSSEAMLTGQVVQQYLKVSLSENENVEEELLDVRAPSGGKKDEAAETQNHFAQYHRSDHGRNDGFLRLLHRDIHSTKHPPGRRRANPPAPVHDSYIPDNYFGWKIPVCIHDCWRTGFCAAC